MSGLGLWWFELWFPGPICGISTHVPSLLLLVWTACCVPRCLRGIVEGWKRRRAVPSIFFLLFRCLSAWSFGVWLLKSQLDEFLPCPAWVAPQPSFGVTLPVLLLYLPFIDNQLLDNEQVLVHLKDCLMGGGMVERKEHGVWESGRVGSEYWPDHSVPTSPGAG